MKNKKPLTDEQLEDVMRKEVCIRHYFFDYVDAKVELELRLLGEVLGFKRSGGKWVRNNEKERI